MKLTDHTRTVTHIAIGSGIFTGLVAILLLLNFVQVRKYDPLETEAMEILVKRLETQPKDQALKDDIRRLDLLARKAYFNNRWQIKTGAWLLLIGGVIFVLALRILTGFSARAQLPGESYGTDLFVKSQSQKCLFGVFGLLLLAALAAAYFSNDHLKRYDYTEPEVLISKEDNDEIEIIEIQEEGSSEIEAESPVALVETSEEDIEEKKQEDTPEEEAPEKIEEEVLPAYPELSTLFNHHNAFRGALGNGVSYRKNIPNEWDGASGLNVLWKVAIPKPGYNSPVLWGDKLFLASADKQSRVVYCYNRYSGALLWKKQADNIEGSPASPPKVTEDTGLSASSVTTDGIRVYVIFGTGDVISFDMEGNRIWARNLGVPDNHYGHSSSLLSWQEKLFVQYDTNKGGKVMALHCETGESIWETTRGSKISWASPILAQIGGKLQLVLSSAPLVAGYDTDTGKELWKVDCLMGEVGPSPSFGEGLIFAANEYATLAAIRPGSSPSIVWEDNEYLPEVASPVVFEGLLFIATSYGVIVCYDAKTGEKAWEHECDEGFYASPLVADGKLYAMDMEGVMHIFKASREKELLGEPELGEASMASPAFANKRVYIRGKNNLYCIGVK